MHQPLDDEETDAAIDAILARHRIPSEYHAAFYRLAEDGVIESDEFHRRLKHSISFQVACEEIMELLSRPFSYLVSSGPSHFESL